MELTMSAEKSSNETLLQSQEGPIESQNESQEELSIITQNLHNLKQLKSFEILISSLKIFTSNFKFTFLVTLSIIPLLFSMVFFEFKLQKSILYASSNSLLQNRVTHVFLVARNSSLSSTSNTPNMFYYSKEFQLKKRKEFLSDALQTSVFYLFLYPILVFFSIIVTIKITAKIHGADKQLTLSVKEVLHQKVNFKGTSITYLCIHVLTTLTLVGLLWVVTNYQILSDKIYPHFYHYNYDYYFFQSENLLNIVSIAVHAGIFLALLYKYLDWSSFWNLGMVISVLEEQTGISSFGLSDYYGKHCRKIGFQLMLVLFMFGNVLRLLSLCVALSNGSVAGVVITVVAVMCFSFANLVKWVVFVLYYFYCKQQTMEKKVDDRQELGQTVSSDVP